MNVNAKKYIIIIFLTLFIISCVSNQTEQRESHSSEKISSLVNKKWQLWQKAIPDDATPLTLASKFDPENGRLFTYPSSFLISKDNYVYVVDNNGHSIYRITPDLKSTELFVNGNKDELNKIQYPDIIREFNDQLFVNDEEGIKIFSKNGELRKTIRIYFAVNDYIINDKGEFIINPNFLNPKEQVPLLIKLNENGKKIGSIGKQKFPQELAGLEDEVHLEKNGETIIAAHKRLPLIEVFNGDSGQTLKEFEAKSIISNELDKLKQDKEFINPEEGRYKLPTYIGGVKYFQNQTFVLLHLPYPEIVEFNSSGEKVKSYRFNDLRVIDYFGFDMRLVNNARQFIIGVFDTSRKPIILVLNERKDKS